MKKILITGANSYIGTSFERYLTEQYPEQYRVDTVDMQDARWKETDFSGYDAVFHVAGIAHSETKVISEEQKNLYFSVNTDLTVETAKKAKADGVSQFIFMSSAIVYGESAPIGKEKIITKETKPKPANCYGESKLKAEEGLCLLRDENFKVVILRPPMIYGKNSRGNFPVLERLALKLPVFPKVDNARSMLYIGNLTEFIRLMIENEENGLFWPQNREWSNTGEIVQKIAQIKGRKVVLVPGFDWALKLLSHMTRLVNKAFGNLCYDPVLSEYKEEYRKYSLIQSIEETER